MVDYMTHLNFEALMQNLIDSTPDSDEKNFLLENHYWYTVYPFNNGYANDIYYQNNIDGEWKWSELSRNSIFSSSHLIPTFPTEKEARENALETIKNTIKIK